MLPIGCDPITIADGRIAITMNWKPDFTHILDAARNRRPVRLPLYEHIIDPKIIAQVLDTDMAVPQAGDGPSAFTEYYAKQVRFWREMTYDTISVEGVIVDILPDHGAIMGGRPGPIQSRGDFERYPWDELCELYWRRWAPHFKALGDVLPADMKVVGGVGNGVFEISEDLVGYERLCLMMYDDPELIADLYRRIGDLMVTIWTRMLRRYGDLLVVGRMGDDLGFKTSTLVSPEFIIEHIVPQHRRIVSLVHDAGKPFLLHSCGKIFSVMDDLIATGIDAKHSNEDQIAPFSRWIELYSDRIALFGGIDFSLLCGDDPKAVFEETVRLGVESRKNARGFALGSGNSIPDYIPVDNYLAMVHAAKAIRRREL